jgi:hypothetical protein
MIGPNVRRHNHITLKPRFIGSVRTLTTSHQMAANTKNAGNIAHNSDVIETTEVTALLGHDDEAQLRFVGTPDLGDAIADLLPIWASARRAKPHAA